jgi:hypothetical protein
VQRFRPLHISPDVLHPTLCVSGVGMATSGAFGPTLATQSKVHTSLVSMLGRGNTALMRPILQHRAQPHRPADAVRHWCSNQHAAYDAGAHGGQMARDATGRAGQTQHVLIEEATAQEARGGARSVSAKHLPPHLQRRYASGSVAPPHRPDEVHALQYVLKETPSRCALLSRYMQRIVCAAPQ